jgi:hypothetical protein
MTDKNFNNPQKPAAKTSTASDPLLLEKLFPSVEGLFAPREYPKISSPDVLVAFDTNALLVPYHVGEQDLKALADVLKKLADAKRVFVPTRVIREFTKNRDRKLAEMAQALNDIKSRVQVPKGGFSPLLESMEVYHSSVKAFKALEQAKRNWSSSMDRVIETVKNWRGDDPVAQVYASVFLRETFVEQDEPLDEKLLEELRYRYENKIPPGYKDAGKPDGGIGDFLIWKSLLKLGTLHKKDLVFVTGEEKADWSVRANNEALYPRPELVDEYRRASSGRSIRLCSLHELLGEMDVSSSVVRDVKTAEEKANTAFRSTQVKSWPPLSIGEGKVLVQTVAFDYSTKDGMIAVGSGEVSFNLRFSKASNDCIHFYKDNTNLQRIARVKGVKPGELVDVENQDTSSRVYTINLGESFLAINNYGHTLVGRIIDIQDDSRGADHDEVTFTYALFSGASIVTAV